MDYRQLGRTDLNVSALCLGSMTWGEQNDQAQAFAQIERAKAAGSTSSILPRCTRSLPARKPTPPPSA